jgi:pyrroline-5-carboxylate reductase
MNRAPRKLGFIGAGNMAGAMIRGLLDADIQRRSDLWVADTAGEQLRRIRRRHGVGAAADNRALVAGSRIVVLAVKPQVIDDVLKEIHPEVRRHHLFISIAAGVPLRRLEHGLGESARVVRVMPNTPALLGKGISVLVKGSRATARDLRVALRLFRAVGDALAVDDERLLDPVTGVSGSGPAYVYRFAEALIEAASAQGLESKVAGRLVFRTMEGAAAMLLESGMTPKELREMVSSPGGTTVAGLAALEQAGFTQSVARAVEAATGRSRELGGR